MHSARTSCGEQRRSRAASLFWEELSEEGAAAFTGDSESLVEPRESIVYDEPRSTFPIYAVSLRDVEKMTAMISHEDLKPERWEPSKGPLCFVSHQWTSRNLPDHTGKQFELLKHTIRDLNYLFTDSLHHMSHAKVPPIKPDEYVRLWLWLDYWSVPQSAQRADERSAAIDSIPAYAVAASFILVLCPTVVHRDLDEMCNFASWERRGWCRLERLAFSLAHYSVSSPPYVYVVHEPGKVERCMNSKFHKPSQSVFCGEFTVMDDRVRLLPVVQSLIDHGCQARKLQGDVAAWRKLLAMKRTLLFGCFGEEGCGTLCGSDSVEDFLAKYEFTSVTDSGPAGMTPLHYAAYEDNAAAVRGLISAGADVNVRDTDEFPYGGGATPLFYGAVYGSFEAVQALLEARADANNAAITAPSLGHLLTLGFSDKTDFPSATMLSLLLAHGLDITAEADWRAPHEEILDSRETLYRDMVGGATLLFLAVKHKQLQQVQLLLQRGADPLQPCGKGCHEGLNPLDMARKLGFQEMVILLEEKLKDNAAKMKHAKISRPCKIL